MVSVIFYSGVVGMSTRLLEIVVPARIYELLEKCEEKTGMTKEDLIARAIVKLIEETLEKRGRT